MSEEDLRLEAQRALDDLWTEGVPSFKLTANKVESDLGLFCTITFNDSRLYSITVRRRPEVSLGSLVREAILREIVFWLGQQPGSDSAGKQDSHKSINEPRVQGSQCELIYESRLNKR